MVPPRGRMPVTERRVERPPVVFDEAAPAVLDAEDLRAFVQHRAAHDGAYDRVQAGAVAAPRHEFLRADPFANPFERPFRRNRQLI
jgi:hypothetical protein